jgi:hypothetical protein
MIPVNGYNFDADRVLLYPYDAYAENPDTSMVYRLADILFPPASTPLIMCSEETHWFYGSCRHKSQGESSGSKGDIY